MLTMSTHLNAPVCCLVIGLFDICIDVLVNQITWLVGVFSSGFRWAKANASTVICDTIAPFQATHILTRKAPLWNLKQHSKALSWSRFEELNPLLSSWTINNSEPESFSPCLYLNIFLQKFYFLFGTKKKWHKKLSTDVELMHVNVNFILKLHIDLKVIWE